MKHAIKNNIVGIIIVGILLFLVFPSLKKQVQKIRLDCPGGLYNAHQGKFTAHITKNGDVECVATSEKDCSRSINCKRFGACTYVPIDNDYGVCELKTSEDCRWSTVCKEEGGCHYMGSRDLWSGLSSYNSRKMPPLPDFSAPQWVQRSRQCRPYSEEDCGKTWECKNWGRCSYLNRGVCHAGHNQGCARSKVCAEEGLCKAGNGGGSVRSIVLNSGWFYGVCLPVSDEMCRKSDHCRISGECSAGKRRCFADLDSDCQASEVCAKEGKCLVITGGLGRSYGRCSSKEDIRD